MRFVERIPARVRVRPRAGKRLHRQAMERILPPGIAGRPKHGFATPYDDWLRASLGEEVERRYAPGSALAELVEPAAVARLVDEHRRGRADHKAMLYCLLELSEWHGAFVEAREPVARVKRPGFSTCTRARRASWPIDREILAERYEIEDLYQPGRLPNPVKVIARGPAGRPRVRLVRLVAHVLPDHAGLAAAQAVGAGRSAASTWRTCRTSATATSRAALRKHASRWIFRRADAADHELALLAARRSSATRRSRPSA